MNENLRAELERLKERQAQLHHGLDLLGVHIRALEKRIAEQESGEDQAASAQIDVEPGVQPVLPPLLPVMDRVAEMRATQEPAIASADQPTPFSVGSVGSVPASTSPDQPAAVGTVAQPVSDGLSSGASRRAVPPPLPPELLAQTPPAGESGGRESFEMRLGTYWLVRIGIVAMLTALVFFGTYAYQNYIGKLGPAGKVTLLYLAAGTLLGLGAWFQRKAAKESLRNYAQVLFAGGLAAVYFTTYAAHHFPNLQVIGSATLDGALLLGWAGFMAWVADRKKSEVLALFAVGLAFYTSVITRVGHFTLYSNLVLAVAVLFFLVRNRWAKLSFASLIATYASYGYWRFYSGDGWQWAGPDAGLWAGAYFLVAYWVVFAAATLLSRHRELAGVQRASFITLNNAAFYAMFLLTMFQVRSGEFWKFNVITGGVLLGVAAVARARLRDEPLAANTYLTHALLLLTAGLIAKLNHDESMLAVALGLESVVLWITGTMRRNIIMRSGACVSAALGTLWAIDGIEPNDWHGVWLAVGVGGLLVFNGFWSQWKGQGKSPNPLRVAPTYFSTLALLIAAVAIWQNVPLTYRPFGYSLLVAALVVLGPVLRLRELALLPQALLPAAVALLLANLASPGAAGPWWVFATFAAVMLALVHWWQHQKVMEMSPTARLAGQLLMALMFAVVVGSWVEIRCDAQEWVLATTALGVVLTVYGTVTRNGMVPVVAQGFVGLSVAAFVLHGGTASLDWWAALVPVVGVIVLAVGGHRWAEHAAEQSNAIREGIRQAATWYARVAMGLIVWWTVQYAAVQEWVWSFTALGAVAFVVSAGLKRRDLLVFSLVLNGCALGALSWHQFTGISVYWPNFASVLVWMVEQQIARRQPERFPVAARVQSVLLVLAGLSLWWLVSSWVLQGFSGFYLTASWSLFAFVAFAAGIALRERLYRWLGLGVLGAALARVVIFDVWKLDTLYRILSFFALGLVLLVLGFIYNKYQERIRQWL